MQSCNWPNLHTFTCSFNNLTHLPANINWPNLHTFTCSHNKLTQLPAIMLVPNLQIFNCSFNKLTQLPANINLPNLQNFDCSNNKLTHLPENINWPNLEKFNCVFNQITQLPENINWPNLQDFDCRNNQITHLPAIILVPNLRIFDCSYNKLTQLPANINLPNLQEFFCSSNQLTHLPAIMLMPNLKDFGCSYNNLTQLPDMQSCNWPNLQHFNCSENQLTHLPENIHWPNLQILSCYNNQLTQLPIHIMTLTRLRHIDCSNNPLELSPQIARFINRIYNVQTKQFNVYADGQNVHDSNIQLCIKDSINALTTRRDIRAYNKIQLIETIMSDSVLTCKEQLIEYLEDETVHSLLLLTWGEVLWAVLRTIELDFNIEQQIEIKLILNQEMDDALCKCFTGRMGRVVNCLNGFSPLVNINIKDSDQIGNIIVLIKSKLANNYNVETHKQLVKQELESRGFDDQVINEWIGYIE
jgi:Leucine-rich repeat (LRR) protein